MKIEAGKYYKTRSGKKVYITSVLPEKLELVLEPNYPVQGYSKETDVDDWYAETWTRDGFFEKGYDKNSQDIVEEWKEPIKQECTIFLIREASGNTYFVVDPLDAHFVIKSTIASKKVTLTEGEFADDA